jgi:hypothetical protein
MRFSRLLFTLLIHVVEARDLAKDCTRKRLCNGDFLCADVCVMGSVGVDPFASTALQLQRNLQFDERLARHTLIGSHNSAISLAYGYGIEEDGFETLLNQTLYTNDDLGEGVDGSFTLTDQLNMGLRHLEVDITAGYFRLPPRLDTFFVCHSPVPLDPATILRVEAAARRENVSLGEWKADKLSCLGTTVPLQTMLLEVRAWLHANPNDFIVLYLDTKPLTMVSRSQSDAMSKLLRSVFGDSLWAVGTDGGADLLLNQSVRSLVGRGKRLYVEDHEDAYNKAADRIVFTPAVWSHQFGPADLSAFPECAIGGDTNWYTNVGGPSHPLARGLYDGGSVLSDGTQPHDSARAAATRCGVNVVSPNYVQPRDMAAFVWTWDHGEPVTEPPRDTPSSTCVVQKPNGRWAARDCSSLTTSLPLACRKEGDDLVWRLTGPHGDVGARKCDAGWVARPPTNGFANGMLRATAGTNVTVLLNVSVDGLGPSPALA